MSLLQSDRGPRNLSCRTRRVVCRLLTTLALGLGMSVPSTALAETNAVSVKPSGVEVASRSERDLAVRGIYVQQLTAQNPKKLRYLIQRAKRAGLNTFVVDLWSTSQEYARGVKLMQEEGITFIPRIIMFPDGAKDERQVADRALLEQRWRLADFALGLGAKDIQLDYIRFSSRNQPSPENADKIIEVLRFFRKRIEQRGARLQIDVFGEVSYGPSLRIGQDMQRFAPELDAVCPMLYPSHFEPHQQTVKAPYRTVHGALTALERQIRKSPIPIYAYIEPFNYRHKMSDAEREVYVEAQLQAVLDSSAQGFYVWSVGNYYDHLFNVLERRARNGSKTGGDGALASRTAP
jgi:hypothetical protein